MTAFLVLAVPQTQPKLSPKAPLRLRVTASLLLDLTKGEYGELVDDLVSLLRIWFLSCL